MVFLIDIHFKYPEKIRVYKKCRETYTRYALCLWVITFAVAIEHESHKITSPADYDNNVVDEFAKAMKDKLAKAREKGRNGWHDKDGCTDESIAKLFFGHLQKTNDGNFIDLANFIMFLHHRGANSNILKTVDYKCPKAIKILKDRETFLTEVCENTTNEDNEDIVLQSLRETKEAIAELERFSPANCDGCVWDDKDGGCNKGVADECHETGRFEFYEGEKHGD